jgi:hypothetical protein
MIFTYYLSPEGKQILDLIAKAHFTVKENISWCSNTNYDGGIINDNKTFFVCTKTLMNRGNANKNLNDTVYHEAVHVVQSCIGMKPIGIPLNRMLLTAEKLQYLDNSLSLVKKKDNRRLEHEAYWLEDKPKETIKYLRKFCF